MKTLIKIAQTELRLLFYSPVAWLIMIIFAIQAGIEFSAVLESELKYKASGYSLSDETASLFSGWRGLFSRMQQYLYLYIPLLTMSIMSREYSSGSIKLLFSSPIKTRQIIFGKYLALLIFDLLLMAILSLFVFFCLGVVKAPDVPFILSGLLGLFLLTAAYMAIGLFMSSLTSYQMIAALGTLTMLAALNYMRQLGQEIAFVRDITWWLSISGRSDELINGLICSEDIIYFLVVIFMFFTFTTLNLRGKQKRRKKHTTVMSYVSIVLLVIAIGYISSRPQFMTFYDSTRMKSQSLTPNSQEVMKQMDGGLTITTYVNLLDKNYWDGLPRNYKNDTRRFKKYVRFKPEIKMKYVYYYDRSNNPELDQRYPNLSDEERAKELASGSRLDIKKFLRPEEIRKQIDLSQEKNYFVRLLERESGERTFLRIYNDMSKHPNESEITAALKRLVVKPPKIAFITGHGERNMYSISDKGYSTFTRNITFRYALVNQGFDVDTLSLRGIDNIPADVDVLVIADPQTEYSEREQTIIHRYIEAGRDLIVATKPGRASLINPLVAPMKVELLPGTIVCPREYYSPDLLLCEFAPQIGAFSGTLAYLKYNGHVVTSPGATAFITLADNDFQTLPLIMTDSTNCWLEFNTTDFENEVPQLNREIGEQTINSYPIALAMIRNKSKRQQQVLLLGNADCFSNLELQTSRNNVKSANFNLVLETFRWFTHGEFPVNTSRSYGPDNDIYLQFNQLKWVKAIFIVLVPLILTIVGIRIRMKRKKE